METEWQSPGDKLSAPKLFEEAVQFSREHFDFGRWNNLREVAFASRRQNLGVYWQLLHCQFTLIEGHSIPVW